MQALVLDAEQRTAHLTSVKIPIPRSNELLVRVHAIALNPVDSLYTYNPLGSTGRTVGSDFSGYISSLGASVPSSSNLQVGDRVAGFLQGACSINDRPGAFSEYLVVPRDLAWKVPETLELEAASSISLCGLTAAQALFYRLGLDAPFPWPKDEKVEANLNDEIGVFIYGASTSVGLYAAQLVRRGAEVHGKTVILIGAASKRHFELLKAEPYGYDHLVNYRESDWPEQVKVFMGGKRVDYAYDCISEGPTISNTAKVLKPDGKIAVVRSRQGGAWDTPREELPSEPVYGAVWEGLGEDVQYAGMVLLASQRARAFTVAFYHWLSTGGKLQANPIRLMPGGLEKVTVDGFALLGAGNMEDRDLTREEEWMRPVSGEKLVYKLGE